MLYILPLIDNIISFVLLHFEEAFFRFKVFSSLRRFLDEKNIVIPVRFSCPIIRSRIQLHLAITVRHIMDDINKKCNGLRSSLVEGHSHASDVWIVDRAHCTAMAIGKWMVNTRLSAWNWLAVTVKIFRMGFFLLWALWMRFH